ncbi:alpha/beta fold hydrolase [Myceligenerans pegani]|uniref:Alpha/beta hydrolase n=1 Tax=Myceligenerans pegani TaxID=2776917 RepID=A0ABR9N160_9MICO|nr:alpha/beta hydrolase [Myceligenerans sp. TRM 65318]MBE1877400.1 alpha/beta hydrolase [Myceligenerans sp. TRM 65318]MBE3019671.1 alpha/beta hydrolase [Myceligenerans sp. TRM 65318]
MAHEPLLSPYAALIARTPVTRAALTVRGGRAHLWRYGPDDAREHMVLLHGFRGDHHGLEPIVAHLLRAHPDLRVTVPDLPGFGASPPLPGVPHDVAGYAAWARVLLRKLAPGGDAVLAGHSFGSVVAAATTAAPGVPLARRLVLVNPIPRRPLSGRDTLSVGATAVLHALAGVLPEEAGTSLLRHPALTRVASIAMVRTPDRALRRWIHEEHGRYFAGFATRASLLESFRASITASVRDSAAGIDVPTLLIGGARDDLARVGDQRALAARFRDARLRLIPGVGHLTHYETPAEVAEEIATFLAADRAPAAAV